MQSPTTAYITSIDNVLREMLPTERLHALENLRDCWEAREAKLERTGHYGGRTQFNAMEIAIILNAIAARAAQLRSQS